MANTELLRDPNEPDIYGDMEQKIAARKLEKQQELSDLLKNALGKNKEVSPTQAFAASALAILPMIIGRHYAGTEGASIGAKVAGATAPKYAQTLGKPAPEEVAAATSQAKVKQAEIDALTKQEGSLMSNRLQGQREMARDERLYGEGGLRERYEMRNEARNPKQGEAPYNQLQQDYLANQLAGLPATPEQVRAAVANPDVVDRGLRAQQINSLNERANNNLEFRKTVRSQDLQKFIPTALEAIDKNKPITPEGNKKSLALYGSLTTIDTALDNMADALTLIKRGNLTSDEEAQARAKLNNAFNAAQIASKQRNDGGTQFTEGEMNLYFSVLPVLLDSPSGTWSEFVRQSYAGLDPLAMIAEFKRTSRDETLKGLKMHNLKPQGWQDEELPNLVFEKAGRTTEEPTPASAMSKKQIYINNMLSKGHDAAMVKARANEIYGPQ